MNLYANKKWAAFRAQIIELDGGKCVQCGRSSEDGVVLQVHHKLYIKGRAPWQYEPEACETLCRGCHAREHGEIRPSAGWEYFGEDDLGGLYGTCQLCSTEIRYAHYVQHQNWEPLVVGTVCCDNLTGTQEASNARRKAGKLSRFINSKKWVSLQGGEQIVIKKSKFEIMRSDGVFRLKVNGKFGVLIFKSTIEAKRHLFEIIENGLLNNYLLKIKRR